MSFAFLKQFKIPTILGLSIIFAGIIAGVFLVLKNRTFITKASPDMQPKNITISNITDSSAVISWQTLNPAQGFVTFGQNDPDENSVLDDRDSQKPQNYYFHYVTLKKLLPKTNYKFKVSGILDVQNFTTAAPILQTSTNQPIIGTVLDENAPLAEGIAYLNINGATIQSALIKNNGNFLIPLSTVTVLSSSEIFSITDETTGKLTITSSKDSATVSLRLKNSNSQLPPIKLGETLDLTEVTTPTPAPILQPIKNEDYYDLNQDGKINAADYAIALKNEGKKIKSIRTDLNTDTVIDADYLDRLKNTVNQLSK